MRRWFGWMLVVLCMACSSPDKDSEALDGAQMPDELVIADDLDLESEDGKPAGQEDSTSKKKDDPQPRYAGSLDNKRSGNADSKSPTRSSSRSTANKAGPSSKNRGEMLPDALPVMNLDWKNRIVKEVETQMRFLLKKSMDKFDALRDSFNAEMESLAVPPRIQAVENELAEFYQAWEDEHEAKVLAITEKYEKEIKGLLDLLEPEVWRIAFSTCGTENIGTEEHPSTSITDVDGIVQATWDLIKLRSGLEELQDEGQHYKYNRIFMDRIYKNEIEEKGRFSIFVSDSMHHFFQKDEDVIGVTVTYQRKGLDPSIPLEFRQLVRNRVVRGGTTRYGSNYKPDTTLGNSMGRLRVEKSNDHSEDFLVSTVFYPRLNTAAPNFDNFRDFTAVRDYITAVVNANTGEILDCARWQYMWHISHYGRIAIEKGEVAEHDEEAREMKSFLKRRRR